MPKLTLSLLLIIFSNLIYHSCQKSISSSVNYAASLVVTYLVSLLLCAGLALCTISPQGYVVAFQSVQWPSYLLALGVVGIEAGFLLIYRYGWPLSTAALYTNAVVTILLIPLGVWWLREEFSWLNALGVLMTLGGLVLMSQKPSPG